MELSKKTLLRIGIAVFALYLCIHYWPVVAGILTAAAVAAWPLVLGCVIAYLLNIPMTWYERRYFPRSGKRFWNASRRPVCLLAAILTLLAIAALVIALVLPQLSSCVQLLLTELPDAIEFLVERAARLGILPEDIVQTLLSIDWKSRIGQILELLTSGIGSVMDTVFRALQSVFSGVVTAFLGVIFAIYLLAGKDTLRRQCRRLLHRYLRPGLRQRLLYAAEVLDDCFHRFIVGQCIEAGILGLLCTAGMFLLRLPYAAMVGALVAFTALIPIAGAYIGAGVGAFMILTVSPMQALFFLVFLVILQQLEGNLIYPRVVGSSLGLPGIWVLAAVTVGGGMLGITGMLLGVPVAAALYRFLREDLNSVPAAEKCATPPGKQ